jgi:DNA-binding beta-propeller fold protein YncE
MLSNFAKSCLVLAVLIFLSAISQVQAAVELDLEKTLRPDAAPIDVAVSPDGKSTFVLTDKGTVLVYDDQGNLKDTIQVGPQIDQIEIGPSGEQLFAASRENKTVDIILLTFIQEIQTAGSPFKGAENAPITITVFSDYQ